jgi:hypothetical protein
VAPFITLIPTTKSNSNSLSGDNLNYVLLRNNKGEKIMNEFISLIVLLSLIVAASCNLHDQAKKRRAREKLVKEKTWRRK